MNRKGKNNPAYVDGRTLKKYYCLDCGKQLSIWYAKRCKRCAGKINYKKHKYIGKSKYNKSNPNYKHGKTNNNFCLDCHKKLNNFYAKRCKSCAQKGNRGHCWQGGKSFEPYPLGWNKTFKEQIRYRDKYQCKICGVPEVECNRKHSVHHIDYNKENCKENNLITLCQSCHMKTNFRRKYWKKYFVRRRRNTLV